MQSCDQKSCDICGEETSLSSGSRHCAECHQLMCASCVEVHKKLNTTKFHRVAPLQSSQQQTGVSITAPDKMNGRPLEEEKSRMTSNAQERSLLTCIIHNQPVNFYCKKDQSPLCRTCKLIEHRNCTDFMALEEAAVAETDVVQDTLEGIAIIENELYKVKKAKIFAKENLQVKKQQVADQLQQLRQKFDILEANTVNELEQLYETNATQQDKDTEIIVETQELITQLRRQIEAVGETGTSEERFVASGAAEKDLQKYSEVINDISVITLTDIHFTPHAFWKEVENLGDMGAEKVTQQIGLAKFMPNEMPLKVDTDKEDVFIAALEFFSDGRKLVMDLTNSKIKLFTSDDKFLSEVFIPGEVHDMALLNDSVALVTVPSLEEKSLQKITIVDNVLNQDGCVNMMDTKPGLVTKVDDHTFLTISLKDNKVYIITADEDGSIRNVMNSASGIKRLIRQPVKAQMSIDRNTVYILDFYSGCITVDMSKMKVLHHKELLYEFYGGMAVAEDGSVFMECCRKEHDTKYSNILHLSEDGTLLRKLFPADMSPRIIPLKISGKKLYVFTRNSEKNMVLGCIHYKLL